MNKKDTVSVRVRMNKVGEEYYFFFGYFDVYDRAFVDLSNYLSDLEKRQLIKLGDEVIEEFGYFDCHLNIAVDTFLEIQDKLNVQLATKCAELDVR